MRYKAVVFDLDGTLLNSLDDLALSANHALARCGMPVRTTDEVRRFVGNGVRKLMERAVPPGTDEAGLERCFEAFCAHYLAHCRDHTRPYPGVDAMLSALRRRGLGLAIVSNKLQAGVDELRAAYFHPCVEVAIGERPCWRRKPAPDMPLAALAALGARPGEALYVGDSEVDIATARAAGMDCLSALWGYRDEAFLRASGAAATARDPEGVVAYLDKQ